MTHVNRRTFLKVAGAGAGTLALGEKPMRGQPSSEVVVIGAGAANGGSEPILTDAACRMNVGIQLHRFV